MTFQSVPINIAGPSYQDRSRPLSSQETKNLYPEIVESGKERYVIKSFPGQKIFGSTTQAPERGSYVAAEKTFRIVGQTLFYVKPSGIHESKGTIPGTGRCIFADDGDNIFIIADDIYQYTISTDALVMVTDPDITGAKSVTFLNNQFIYTFDTLSVVSDVGSGASATSLNAIGAESNPDDLVRDYAFEQILYRFGTKSTETWYNSGTGNPPFERIEGQIYNVGLAAIHSATNTSRYLYWLGSDRTIYRASRGQEERVSTAAITSAINGYSRIDDAVGFSFAMDGKHYYAITFPTDQKTWCVSDELGKNGWFELSKGVTDNRWNAGSIVDCYNKILISDHANGKLYEMDFDTFDIDGDMMQRRRVTSSINGDLLNAKGKRIQMSRMEFIIESGTGLITGQGENPKIMIEPSYDGGRSWSTGTWMSIGRLGEYVFKAEWWSMRSFYDMMVRLTVTDNVDVNIYSAVIDIRLAGR